MRKIGLLLLCVSLAVGAGAQIRFGVKASGTLSNLQQKYEGESSDDSKAGIGFNIGGVLEYSFSKSLALQPELIYSINNIKPEEDSDEVSTRLELQSIQLPINLKYTLGTESLKFYVTAGPYLGYLTSAKAKASANEGGVSGSISVNLFDNEDFNIKHFDYGVGAGAGVEISKFTVGIGYQYGLSNLTGIDKASVKLRSFNLSVGYFF